ncbi:hypothetical protein A3F06_02485 [candidate division TM6 bacterium RIFCSPHIGHO2_12_FULL_36_22]|nr:MAG: hypothetical protein A3F06_02485 [candidate division TM6 bacterium RIFCSPHIGHO2_12_FULL_36_22]
MAYDRACLTIICLLALNGISAHTYSRTQTPNQYVLGDVRAAVALHRFSHLLNKAKRCWRDISENMQSVIDLTESSPTININTQQVIIVTPQEINNFSEFDDRAEFLLRTLKQEKKAQQEASEIISLFILSELKSIERPEKLKEWLTNKLKFFMIRPYNNKTLQGLQCHEFNRAAQQALWIANVTNETFQTLESDIASLHEEGKVSTREVEIIKDMFDRIESCAQGIQELFEYAAQKVKYYGHVRTDKKVSEHIEIAGNNISSALTQLRRMATEKGTPRNLSIELHQYLKLIEDIVNPKLVTRTYKEIEKVIRELTASSSEINLDALYTKRCFGKESRLTMLRETIKYLKVKRGYDEELRTKLERQFQTNVLFKKSMNTIIRDMDAKIDDSTLRITACENEIKFILQELDIYKQTYDLTKEIFNRTQCVKDIESVQAGKGFLIKQ